MKLNVGARVGGLAGLVVGVGVWYGVPMGMAFTGQSGGDDRAATPGGMVKQELGHVTPKATTALLRKTVPPADGVEIDDAELAETEYALDDGGWEDLTETGGGIEDESHLGQIVPWTPDDDTETMGGLRGGGDVAVYDNSPCGGNGIVDLDDIFGVLDAFAGIIPCTCPPAGGWALTGNGGTNPVTNFIGTTNDVALNFRVNNQRAFRLEPNGIAPNVVGGFSGNTVTPGAIGATIGGGGRTDDGVVPPDNNRVTDEFGTVGGGEGNQAGNGAGTTDDRQSATVGGGVDNTASGYESTIGGGGRNTASGSDATVGGGALNAASGNGSTVGGGTSNTASGDPLGLATVGGGQGNSASSNFATIGGGFTNTASGGASTISGGQTNTATASYSTVGGGNLNTASRDYATVGGGKGNIASAAYGTIGGGGETNLGNPATANRVTDDYGTVGGGGNNQAGNAGTTGDARFATVSGGHNNAASGPIATVGGGDGNTASGFSCTVSGGRFNTASNLDCTVGGGISNMASGAASTIGGGQSNIASALDSTVGGGEGNMASGGDSTVGGGVGNTASGFDSTVGGGVTNTASNTSSTVGGGDSNTASGEFATVPGGSNNTAGGQFSFAAGQSAKVRDSAASGNPNGDHGTFVWADSVVGDFTSTGPNQFLIRASGGVGIGTSAPADQVHLSSTGSNRIFVESVSASLTAFAGIRQRTALREYFSGVNLGNTWTVFDNTAGAARLTILPDGKVGIGRPPAANIFEVEGTASKSAAGDWLANSDARIKKKVETIGSALATIDKVRLVSFEYTDEYRAAHPSIEARSYMNVIAQEFAEVFPDHVKGSGEKVPGSDDEVLQVDPYPLTIYSAAAIQELHAMLRAKDAQLADQGARLADQGTQLADQGARLAALEAVVSENLIQRKGK